MTRQPKAIDALILIIIVYPKLVLKLDSEARTRTAHRAARRSFFRNAGREILCRQPTLRLKSRFDYQDARGQNQDRKIRVFAGSTAFATIAGELIHLNSPPAVEA
jgi:hypothetical protein